MSQMRGRIKRVTGYVALLRAVNVGGTRKLPMSVLLEICEAAGFQQVKTCIASGNVVFQSDQAEDPVRREIEARVSAYARKHIAVMVRTAAEIADVLVRNPFLDVPRNRILALFVPGQPPKDPLAGVNGIENEQIRLGLRELYVYYPDGMAATRLRIPSEKQGTSRNLNTVAKLAEFAAALA